MTTPEEDRDLKRGWSLGPRPSVDPLVALIDILVWIVCALFAIGVGISYLLATL